MPFSSPITNSHPMSLSKQELLDSLVDSHLIGLRLTEDFSVDDMREHNERYHRSDVPLERWPEYQMPKKEKVRGKFQTDTTDMKQNFVNFAPFSFFGPNIFIHGKELLSPELAEHIFEEGADPKDIPLEEFGKNAADKLRWLYSHESFEQRLPYLHYERKPDVIVKELLYSARQEYPNMISFGDFPGVTEENAQEIHTKIWQRLADAPSSNGDSISVEDSSEEKLRSRRVQELAQQAKTRYRLKLSWLSREDPTLRDRAEALEESFWEVLKQDEYDRSTINNFLYGLLNSDGSEKDIQRIIQNGIELRTQSALQDLVEGLDNPYDPMFEAAEREVARATLKGINWRAVDLLKKQNIAIVATDFCNISPLADTGEEVIDAMGEADSKALPEYSTYIRLAAPNLDFAQLTWLASHEVAHRLDKGLENDFRKNFDRHTDEWLKQDTEHLQKLKGDLQETSLDHQTLTNLARARNIPLDIESPESITEARTILLKDFDTIISRIHHHCSPDTPVPEYSHRSSQIDEMPAIVAELTARFGQRFVKQCVPKLYTATFQHLTAGYFADRADRTEQPNVDGIFV